MTGVFAQFHHFAAIGRLVRVAFIVMVMAIVAMVVMAVVFMIISAPECQARYEKSNCDRFHFRSVE